MEKYKAGDEVKVTIIRGEKEQKVNVVLDGN
jgi:S1-C subfamily serine protease